jgi:heme O synthase-like polyprenyltransferase
MKKLLIFLCITFSAIFFALSLFIHEEEGGDEFYLIVSTMVVGILLCLAGVIILEEVINGFKNLFKKTSIILSILIIAAWVIAFFMSQTLFPKIV